MRIALIADTHLSERAQACVGNWHAGRRLVERLAPCLTVHLGDITLDGQSHPEELVFAARLVHDWPVPMHCVPGNHDVGDGSGEVPLSSALTAAYASAFGADHWAIGAPGWRLIGVNAQLFGTDSPQELALWRWIEAQAAEAAAHVGTVLFLHRPLARPCEAERSRRGRYVPDAATERLLQGPLRSSLRVVVSGHTHQYLDLTHDGVRHVWMPSAAFVFSDATQPRIGEKLVGIGLLELPPDSAAAFHLVIADGMRRHDAATLQVN